MTLEQSIERLHELKAQFMPLEKGRAKLVTAAQEINEKLKELSDGKHEIACQKAQKQLTYLKAKISDVDTKREELMAEISKIVRNLMAEHSISSSMLCQLLATQTRLQWVPVSVGGDVAKVIEKNDTTIRRRHIYFGEALVNENHIDFRDKQMFKGRVFDKHFNKNSIAAAVGHVSGREESPAYRSGALREQAESRTKEISTSFNWLFYYLYLKGCFPESLTPEGADKLELGDEVFNNWPDYPYNVKLKSKPNRVLESIEGHSDIILGALDRFFGLKAGMPRKRI